MRANTIGSISRTAGILMTMAIMASAETKSEYQEMMEAGLGHQRRRAWSEAVQAYKTAIDLADDDAQRGPARLGLGRNLISEGKTSQGREVLEQYLKREGSQAVDQASAEGQASVFRDIGRSYAEEGRHEAAAESYNRILTIESYVNPAYRAMAWVGIGRANFGLGRYEEAREAYEQALSIDRVAPIHLRVAWPGIGDSYRAEGRYDEARAAYERVLAAENADDRAKGRAAVSVGDMYYDNADYPAAARAYFESLERRLHNFRVILRLDTIFRMQLRKADELLEAGKYEKARLEYEKVFDMERVEDHHKATAQLGIADSLAGAKQFASARAAYAEVLTMPGAHWPDRGRAQMGVARMLEAEGNAAEAHKAYSALLEMENISRFDRAEAQSKLR